MNKEKIVDRAGLKDIIKSLKSKGKKVVFTNGCFDLIHAGHISYLGEAKKLGDVLVIGTYNEDGSLYLWGNEVSRNHTPEKYHQALRPRYEVTGFNLVPVSDDEGQTIDFIDKPVITETPYTLEESKQKQVVRPPNHAARQLE